MSTTAVLTILSLLVVILVLIAVILELRGRLEGASRTLEVEPDWFDWPEVTQTSQGRKLRRDR